MGEVEALEQRKVRYVTAPLDLGLPSKKDVEDKAISVLAEYRTLGSDLKLARLQASGDHLPVEPRVTAALALEEDDPEILWKLQTEPLTDLQSQMAQILSKYISKDKYTYATRKRVYSQARGISCETTTEQEWLDSFIHMLKERLDAEEEYLPWTSTEKIALRREPWIERAKAEVQRLEQIDAAVTPVLEHMKQEYADAYYLLWYQYVQGLSVMQVRDILGRIKFGVDNPMTEREHRTLRDKSMRKFCDLCPRLMSLQTRERRSKRGPRG
ncbi:hypothetical protein [Alicyclobacillus tolerans]|uniref:hypothetical protein n=1 Tax=Alicyclobacillus tolerans TaxID=90970 RepID=UPI003B98388C